MKFITPEISWHGRDPVYGVDFQYTDSGICRLASCGTDRLVRVRSLSLCGSLKAIKIIYVHRLFGQKWSIFCHIILRDSFFSSQMWEIQMDKDGKGSIQFLSGLNRHTRTVNCVRFSPDGMYISLNSLQIFK
jgi:chromatin assembly factor 1 subunit B